MVKLYFVSLYIRFGKQYLCATRHYEVLWGTKGCDVALQEGVLWGSKQYYGVLSGIAEYMHV